MSQKRVGVIGGGQLAWMMATPAKKLGIKLIVQTPNPTDPAVAIADDVVLGAIDDAQATAKLAQKSDLITFENEFINLSELTKLAEQGVKFFPSLRSLSPLLDKYEQRKYCASLDLPVPCFQALSENNSDLDFPLVLKARRHGYDGQGTFIIPDADSLASMSKLCQQVPMLLEEFIPFERELAVMAARNQAGEIIIYPVVETYQKEQVCRWVLVPAPINSFIVNQVKAIATKLLDKLEVVGIFGIEFFLTPDHRLLVNEIAPRTHNSGHYTIDACNVSQFETQLRAVTGLPLIEPQLKSAGAIMVNLLGYEDSTADYLEKRQQIAALPHTYVHWYGKIQSRPGRKLGHVTSLLKAEEIDDAKAKAQAIESIWYQ